MTDQDITRDNATHRRAREWIIGGLILVLLLIAGARQIIQYDEAVRWVGLSHDRNAHYRYGLELADDLKTGNLTQLILDFDAGSWVWPPLHGLLVAGLALCLGPSPVVATLPSLAGWLLAAFAGYLFFRIERTSLGILPGVLAYLLILTSPAHRAYATDVMLESLGAGLTLLCYCAYALWSQRPTWQRSALLGFVLTLLFFQKFNYWLLVIIPLVLAEILTHFSEYRHYLSRLVDGPTIRKRLMRELKSPLTYPIIFCCVIIIAVNILDGLAFTLGAQQITIPSSRIFVAVGFALILLRITIWWWSGGRHLIREYLPDRVYPLLYWHVFPVWIWFLIPFRLSTFLWFVSPANTERQYHATLLDGIEFYREIARTEYVAHPGILLGLLLGIGLAVAGARTLSQRPAWLAVVLGAIVGMVLTVKHPNHKARFLHTVMPVVILAGIMGGTMILDFVLCRLSRTFRIGLLILMSLGVAGWVVRVEWQDLRGRASEAGLHGRGPSLRHLTSEIARVIPQHQHVLVISNMPARFWAKWCYLEQYPDARYLHTEFREVGVLLRPSAEQFSAWAHITDVTRVIFLQLEPSSPYYEETPDGESNAPVRLYLDSSPFRLVKTIPLSGGTIEVFDRLSSAPSGK